ncbi:carboxypeptidase regulatory-like domain-containing protein [Leptolyngbya sp. BC1307]|uniref:carboxypeptidase regulatory-like domain-containing protein n=1 Tax=Leptolyngbya sp. BC1307 TaxID=2029589 RepID=UPI000EFCC925|nr:carboxypeptidase regulatory-like domain-containing protein [Leptolyngbya sp. BC1307]
MRLNLALALALGAVGWALPVLGHGVAMEHRWVSSVEVQARFETGEPMAQAQVLVYAPDDPAEVWQQSTTDDQGRFSFVPDETVQGNWEVVVRQAGHGAISTIPVTAAAEAAPATSAEDAPSPRLDSGPDSENEAETPTNSLISSSTGLSPVQRGVTIGSVIWGFIGTALFFARGKR